MEEEFLKRYEEIMQLFDIVSAKGYCIEEVEDAEKIVGTIPIALKIFYLNYGKSDTLQHLQDELILPNRYPALLNPEYLIFFDENQGVCQAGIKKEETLLPDPPVYVSMDGGEWILSADKVSDFLVAMFGYQASICLEYSPEEIYFITAQEKERISKIFKTRAERFKNWFECNITLYGDNQHGRIAIMEQESGDMQMNYAANTKSEYQRMKTLLEGIGEAI